VMEAKGLLGKEFRTCDSYVKVLVVPDSDQRSRQKSQTVLDCKNPVFHEQFAFKIHEGDEQKRLLVTVWNRERNSRRSELMGCMSFGVKSLLTPNKEIGGWYYLLGEELGRTKHLKVATRRLKPHLGKEGVLLLPENGSTENMEQLKVTIPRGKDGFGFTICCDSPVRVQAVDPGGPADEAGLQPLDTILQLNGQPVEHWKCVELAHAIRNCRSEIVVLVWRLVPQIKPGFENVTRRASYKSTYDLQSPPNKREKNGNVPPRSAQQRRSCQVVYNGTDEVVVNNWERQDPHETKGPRTVPTLTRLSSTGDKNFIILAPLKPGSQLLRPVYHENRATLSSVCRSKGKAGLQRRSTLIKTAQTVRNCGNYQNCTILRPQVPHSSYGTYVTLAPKVLVFPVFVQPFDLCNPLRVLILSEELFYYESRSKSTQ
uniref:Regulator of G protein signaling 3 n=1 Tax=Latimeria chalumnae TaxID=7897 RepID=H3B7M0_LATCH